MSGVSKHKFQSALADGAQPTQIQPQRDWNDEHVFAGSTTGGLLAYDGAQSDHAAWVAPAAGAGQILRSGAAGALPAWSALTVPNTIAQGDLLAGTAANVAGAIAAAAAGKILRAAGAGTLPAWSTLTIPDTVVQGDLLMASAANVLASLADVAIGSVLVSGGVGAVPAWSASPTLTTLTLTAGSGTQTGKSPIAIFTSTASASNVGTAETDLITYTLPANTLPTNGQKLRITVWGTLANNANAKTIKPYFGGTVLQSYAGGTAANVAWRMVITVARTGATSQLSIGDGVVGSTPLALISGAPAETLSGAVTIKVTGQSGTGSNDVTALGMYVEWLP